MKLGLKSKSMANNVIRSLAIMFIGLLMIFVSESAMPIIVRIAGAAFFLPALVSIVTVYVSRKEGVGFPQVLISIIDVGCMAFGVWLMIKPLEFVSLFTVLLGVILILFALFQIVMIVSAQKQAALPMALMIIPLLLVIAGVFFITGPFEAQSTTSIVFGICAAVGGISDLVISIKIDKAGKAKAPQSGSPVMKR